MLYKHLKRWALGALLFTVLLTFLRFEPWKFKAFQNTRSLQIIDVGLLPVTCHLPCPVTDYAPQTSDSYRYDSQRFQDFPTMVESIRGDRLEATFMNVPLAMKLREQGVPVRIVYLGHRDGSTVMVRPDLDIAELRDLRGVTFAIPSKCSNQY